MGPPPRSFAADAHHCIMVRVSGPTEYKDVARMFVHHTRAPLDIVILTSLLCRLAHRPRQPSMAGRGLL